MVPFDSFSFQGFQAFNAPKRRSDDASKATEW